MITVTIISTWNNTFINSKYGGFKVPITIVSVTGSLQCIVIICKQLLLLFTFLCCSDIMEGM